MNVLTRADIRIVPEPQRLLPQCGRQDDDFAPDSGAI